MSGRCCRQVTQSAVVEIPAPAEESQKAPPGLYSVALEPRYRFENFVVGKANEVAFNAAQTLASADKVAFNPLFLHGGTGRGKTHLLHAIGHEFHRLQPRAQDHLHVGREVHGRVRRARCAPTRRSSSSSSCARPTC